MSGTSFNRIKIGIIDLKSHNLFSIFQATKNIGYNVSAIQSYKETSKKDIIIIPGVGSFKCNEAFKSLNIDHELNEFVIGKINVSLGYVWECNFYFHPAKNSILKRFELCKR